MEHAVEIANAIALLFACGTAFVVFGLELAVQLKEFFRNR